MLEDFESAPVTPRLRAALRLLHAMTRFPTDVDAEMVDSLRADLSEAEILSVASVGFRFALMNRAADAFGFTALEGRTKARVTSMLDLGGRLAPYAPPDPPAVQGADGALRPPALDRAWRSVGEADGALPASLRRDIEAYAAGLRGVSRPEVSLDPVLEGYVGRVAIFPWGLDDQAMQSLRDAGHGDDAIYEITVAACFGASIAAVEPLYAVLFADA